MNLGEYGDGISTLDRREEVVSQLRRGKSLGDVARQYGISIAHLCQWIAETATAFDQATIGTTDGEQDEIRRLRLENEYLRKQRDFYRKAAGIVAVDLLPIEKTQGR